MELTHLDLLILRDGWVEILQNMTEHDDACDCGDHEVGIEEAIARISTLQAMIRGMEARSAAMENHAANASNKVN